MIKDKTRESNFELMRITSMFLIVLYHVIYHSELIFSSYSLLSKVLLSIIETFTLVGVNSFILLTGYFQSKSKFKLKKFINLLLLYLLYKIFIYIILSIFHTVPVFKTYMFNLDYWFVFYYLILYLMSDFLNKIINRMSLKIYTMVLLGLTFLCSITPMISNGNIITNNGFGLIQFIYLYFIGAYIRLLTTKYKLKNKKIKYISLISYIGLTLFIVLIYYLVSNININNNFINGIKNYSFLYSSIFVIIQSISYFILFYNLNIKSKFINNISIYIIGVYLIHDNFIIRNLLSNYISSKVIYTSTFNLISLTFIYSIIIFIGSYLIHYFIIKGFSLFKLFIKRKDNQSS